MPSVEADPAYAERYEPLYDPKKQDVHFRETKSKILRSLGTASYRNGSQFAMIWVSPTGEVADAFASEGLQPKLEEWLGKRVQAEAREMVKVWKVGRERRHRLGEESIEVEGVYGTRGEMFDPETNQVDEEMSEDEEGTRGQRRGTRSTRGSTAATSSTRSRTAASMGALSPTEPNLPSASSRPGHRTARSVTSLDPEPIAQPSPAPSTTSITSPTLPSSNLALSAQVPIQMSSEQLDGWFTARLGELSHKTDKIVCRSWIKVIEPNKQTKFQYQKGDDVKPVWWPPKVRHKEPDHLGKHERIALLLHLLRLPFVTINQLECSTSAVPMQIPPHKLPILQNIYETARAERKALQATNPLYREGASFALSPLQPPEPALPAIPSPLLPAPDSRANRTQRPRAKNAIESPGASDLALSQQTPRSTRASPYPLARSASASHELSNLSLNSATSPSLGHSPASTSLSRSQSHAGPVASTSRAPRMNGRASIGEGDLHATPYQGGRIRSTITPRQAGSQASPLSASMGRSASTSAIGAKTMMDDSVASPAMIKSRSKLSQKCFEQMGAGSGTGLGEHRGGGREDYLEESEYGQLPHHQFAMVHPHHLQSMRPHPEGFPPPPAGSAQPQLLVRHPPAQNPPQPHPAHLHRSSPSVQVQVQVHAGHGLPVPPPQPRQNSAYGYASQGYPALPVPPSSSHFASPELQQQSMHFIAPNGLVYEHAPSSNAVPQHRGTANEEAAYFLPQSASTGGTPSLSAYINSPELSQHSTGLDGGREYLMLDQEGGGGGGGLEGYYLDPSSDPNQSGGEPDLGAYVRQLEGFERQHAQQGAIISPSYEVGLGFEDAHIQHDLSPYVSQDGYY